MKKKVLVLGVGNTLRRDDGVGPSVIQILKQEKDLLVDLKDGGTDGLSVIEYLKPYQKAIVIDAVEMGAEPGAVKLFTPEEAIINIKSESLSTHGFGLGEAIKLMQGLGIKTELKIIGVQPQDISFGEGLTEKIKNGLAEIVKLVRSEII